MSILTSVVWFVLVRASWLRFRVAGITGLGVGFFLAPTEFLMVVLGWVMFSKVKVFA
jgi:intracellular septation protein A